MAAAVVAAALIGGSLLSGGDEATGGDDRGGPTDATGTTDTTASGPHPALALVKGIPQKGTVLGKAGAKVRMLQFEDLQCPICKEYTDDAFPAIVNEYVRTGRIKLDFRGLAFLGPDSQKALRIAIAAGSRTSSGRSWGCSTQNQGEENSGWVTDALIDEILAEVPGLDAAKVKVDAKATQ